MSSSIIGTCMKCSSPVWSRSGKVKTFILQRYTNNLSKIHTQTIDIHQHLMHATCFCLKNMSIHDFGKIVLVCVLVDVY